VFLRSKLISSCTGLQVIVQNLRESGVFSSVIASAPSLSKENFLLSIDSSNSSRAADAVTLSSRKAGRTKESQAATRRVLSFESAASFHEVAVPPLSPPREDDNDLISLN